MKKRTVLMILTLFILSFPGKGQEISLGYLGHIGYHPGASISAKYDLKQWDKKKSNTLFVMPKLGFYSWPGYNSNYMIGTDFGIQRNRENKKIWHSYAIGLGYVLKYEVLSTTVNFSGDIIHKNREARHELLTLFGYRLGSDFNSSWGWYAGGSVGFKGTLNIAGSVTAYLETGISYRLNLKK